MKRNVYLKFLSVLLTLVILVGAFPAVPTLAWDIYVECEFCGAGCGDDYICSGGDHCGPDSGRECYDEHHCIICYECFNNTEFCEECHMCEDCAKENLCHCVDCGTCGVDAGQLCGICGKCYECGGMCSDGPEHACLECHLEEDMACGECGTCFVDDESSKKCAMCGRCLQCSGRCNADEDHACLECHLEEGMACPNCGECYVDNEQESCTDCGSCYGCVDLICEDCGRCDSCTQMCEHCKEICIDCHESDDEVCPDCGMCGGGDPMCWECGGCLWCYWICDTCGLCGECSWENHCPECDACYSEFDRCPNEGDHCEACCEGNGWLCPECGECIEGNGYELVCRDCGVCEGCSEFCDFCGDFCLDCLMNEEALHCPECGTCYDGVYNCYECDLCENCVEICEYCEDYCMDCAADLGYHCSGCGDVCLSSGDPYCPNCELCADCVDEYCEECERCVECAIDEELHCQECGECFNHAAYCMWCLHCENCLDDEFCFACGGCKDCIEEYSPDWHCLDCRECFSDVSACKGGCGYCENCCRCAYTVSFDANGGIGTMPNVKVYGVYVLPECGFAPPINSIFSGWMVDGVSRSVGETVIITEYTVITAAWRRTINPITPFSISFRANGGAGTMDTVSLYGSKYVLPACQFTAPRSGRDVMVFAGWLVNNVQGVLPAGVPVNITGNTVLTAVWTEMTFNTYSVFFDANGGIGIFGPVHRLTGTYTLPDCYFTAPAGKQFKAWEAGGVQYAPGDKLTVTVNTNVKAIWEDVYILIFDANGGEGTMDPYAMTKGEYKLPACSFTAPEGMKFSGWDVGGRVYSVGTGIYVNSHKTIKAVWEAAGDFLPGDSDSDGDITTRDVLLIRKYLAGLVDEYAIDLIASDVNLDAEVSTKDVLKIRKYLAGLIDELP